MLFAEESTIIDTIWTENTLQGAIGYHVQNETYYGGIIPSLQGTFGIGDSYDQYNDFNDIALRAYISFPIQTIPINYQIDSVYIRVYQADCVANEQFGFPIWFNNEYYPCNLYHVDYGLTFEPADFDPIIYDTLGAISTDDSIDWKMLNITDAYIADMQNSRTYCQLMLKFPILTDYDQMSDMLIFGSSYAIYHPLHLIISYSSITNNADYIDILTNNLSIFPNPSRNNISISIKNRMKLDKVDIYNIKGQKVLSETSLRIKAGETKLNFDKSIMSAGIYILKAQVTSKNKTYTITKRISVY